MGELLRGAMTGAGAQAKPIAMIYLIRHGQTEFNREGRFQGQCDSPLTDLGRDQAARVGARLAGLIGDPAGWRLSTSPLGRAADTARIIQTAAGLPQLALDPRLAEISMGSWDGLTEEEIAMVSPEVRVASRYDLFFASPDGEGYDAIAARLQDWLDQALADGRTHVAVSHGVAGRVLRGLYLGLGRAEQASLPVPQDAIFRLAGGAIERIDADPAALVTDEPGR
jgi:broad specificity phosphatase PhoE